MRQHLLYRNTCSVIALFVALACTSCSPANEVSITWISKHRYPPKPANDAPLAVTRVTQQSYAFLAHLAVDSVKPEFRDTVILHDLMSSKTASLGADAYIVRWLGSGRCDHDSLSPPIGIHVVAIRFRQKSDPPDEGWLSEVEVWKVLDDMDRVHLKPGMVDKARLRSLGQGMQEHQITGSLGEPKLVEPHDFRRAYSSDGNANPIRVWFDVTVPDAFKGSYSHCAVFDFNDLGELYQFNRASWGWR